MATLEQRLEQLDQQIAEVRQLCDKSQDSTEREKLTRSIEMLNTHERAAIKKLYTERAEREQREEQAAQAAQQKRADAQEADDRRMLRLRWTGNDASFEEAYPEMIKQLRIDRALGRSIANAVPSPRIEF